MSDGLKFKGTVSWIHYGALGEELDRGCVHNQPQNYLFEEVIQAIDGGTYTLPIIAMAVGSSTGQHVGELTLESFVSVETSTGSTFSKSQPSAAQLSVVATFTGMAAGTISEAGLFGVASGTSAMACYDDSLSVSIGGTSDSLQITWTVDAQD